MELRILILAFLEARPLYGYELVQRARTRARLQWKEGTIYPLLHKMEGEKILQGTWQESPAGKRRKYYALTDRGHSVLRKARTSWKREVQTLSGILLGGRHG